MNALKPNKYPGACAICGTRHLAGVARVEPTANGWRVRCVGDCVPNPGAAKAAAVQPRTRIGNLAGIFALFDQARKHLKFPAIVLVVPGTVDLHIRINVAGPSAKEPGSLTVCDAARDEDTRKREWLGRIHKDGTFWATNVGKNYMPRLAQRLTEFADNPAKVAGEDGRLHGRCCFCRQALTDERSTAVGYGKTCASHFGLPWGDAKTTFSYPYPRDPQTGLTSAVQSGGASS